MRQKDNMAQECVFVAHKHIDTHEHAKQSLQRLSLCLISHYLTSVTRAIASITSSVLISNFDFWISRTRGSDDFQSQFNFFHFYAFTDLTSNKTSIRQNIKSVPTFNVRSFVFDSFYVVFNFYEFFSLTFRVTFHSTFVRSFISVRFMHFSVADHCR